MQAMTMRSRMMRAQVGPAPVSIRAVPRPALRPLRAVASPAQSELDVLSALSVVVPDSVAGQADGRKMKAATVSFNLMKAVCSSESLGMKPLENAISAARTYDPNLDKQVEKAMVNVGAILADQVEGRVSTEIDPRLANDKDAMVAKARSLAKLYEEVKVPSSKLLFRLPATWAGISAAKELEAQGLATHVYLVFSLMQGAAAAQAGASLVNPNVGRVRDWFNRNPGMIRNPKGPRQDAGLSDGVDPGIQLVTDVYNYIKAYHPKTKVLATGIRSRDDALALSGCDYLVLPAKVMSELAHNPTAAGYNDGLHNNTASSDDLDEAVQRKLTSATAQEDAPDMLPTITESSFMDGLGLAGKEMLAAGLADALKDVEALAALTKATTGVTST